MAWFELFGLITVCFDSLVFSHLRLLDCVVLASSITQC